MIVSKYGGYHQDENQLSIERRIVDTPRFMSADEVFDKLNIDKLDWEDQEAC